MKVFIDTSVFFSAVYSAQGYARELLLLSVDDKVTLVVSDQVMTELERNLLRKVPEKLPAYQALLALLKLERVPDPPPEKVDLAAAYVAQKDASSEGCVDRSRGHRSRCHPSGHIRCARPD